MDLPLRRRTLLAAGAGGLLLPLGAGALRAEAADEFDTLRARAAELATGGAIDPTDPVFAAALGSLNAQADAVWAALDRGAGRTALWADLAPVTEPANFATSYARLSTLAVAWATPGAEPHADETVAGAIVDALAFL